MYAYIILYYTYNYIYIYTDTDTDTYTILICILYYRLICESIAGLHRQPLQLCPLLLDEYCLLLLAILLIC